MGMVRERKGNVLVLHIGILKTLPGSQASRVRVKIVCVYADQRNLGTNKKSEKAHYTDHGQIHNYSDAVSDYCHAVF